MVFNDWLLCHDRCRLKDSIERREALARMKEEAQSFEEWRNLFLRAKESGIYHSFALAKMMELACKESKGEEKIGSVGKDTASCLFGYWLFIYRNSPEGYQSFALDMLMRIAERTKTKEDMACKAGRWRRIFEVVPLGSHEENHAAQKLIEEFKRLKT